MLVSSSALHDFDDLAFVSGLCPLCPSSVLAKCFLQDLCASEVAEAAEALGIGSVQVLTWQMEREKSFSVLRRWGRAGESCPVWGSMRPPGRGLCLVLCLLLQELVGKSAPPPGPHPPELFCPEIWVIICAKVLCCVHAWWHCDIFFCYF